MGLFLFTEGEAHMVTRPLLSAFLLGIALLGGGDFARGETPRDLLFRLEHHDPRELAEMLKSKDVDDRRDAAWCLGRMRGSDAVKALGELIDALDDPDHEVRTSACCAMAHIGPAAKAAVPGLARCLRDENVHVRKVSAWALTTIGPGAKEAERALLKSLEDEDKLVRLRAAAALIAQGRRERELFSILIEALMDHELGVEASYTLSDDLGEAPIPILKECLKDIRPRIRSAATGVLRSILERMLKQKKPLAPELITALIGQLKDDDKHVIRSAILSIGRLGEPAREAIPEISDFLKHEDWHLRYAAAQELRKFGYAAKVAIPRLKEAAKNPDELEIVHREIVATLKALE
jgi:HEAT repeat protein